MNPLLKLLLKQAEENAVIVEKYVKVSERYDHWEMKIRTDQAFNDFSDAFRAVKNVVEELI